MKKNLFAIFLNVLLLLSTNVFGQGVNIYKTNGTIITVPCEELDSIVAYYDEDPYNGHEYVDLGLSVKWATCNIGAKKPEAYGERFSWGEIQSKESYNWGTYTHCVPDGKYTYSSILKYNNTDKIEELENSDDAANVKWGGKWRMPTQKEINELLNKCKWSHQAKNGVKGVLVTGPNGNSIFLPATGHKVSFSDKNDEEGTTGFYWTKTLESRILERYAIGLVFNETNQGESSRTWSERCNGFSVRAVIE